MDDSKGLAIAFEEAKLSYAEGGIPVGPHPSPSEEEEDRARAGRKEKKKGSKCADETATAQIGAALISKDGKLLGRGHNQRVQLGSAIHHGETSALYNSGRLPARAYVGSTMYTTLSPCDMCNRVVIGENKNYLGGEAYLRSRGVEVVVLDDAECREFMDKFIAEKPDLWNEDIGVEERVWSKEGKSVP